MSHLRYDGNLKWTALVIQTDTHKLRNNWSTTVYDHCLWFVRLYYVLFQPHVYRSHNIYFLFFIFNVFRDFLQLLMLLQKAKLCRSQCFIFNALLPILPYPKDQWTFLFSRPRGILLDDALPGNGQVYKVLLFLSSFLNLFLRFFRRLF